jgi:hypothetical protein
MTNQPPLSDRDTALEADIEVRKADRQAKTHADSLADRLDEIDLHQREARFLLERAGMLERRARR